MKPEELNYIDIRVSLPRTIRIPKDFALIAFRFKDIIGELSFVLKNESELLRLISAFKQATEKRGEEIEI